MGLVQGQRGQIFNEGIAKDLKQSNSEAISSISNELGKFAIFKGILLKSVGLSGVEKLVPHKLGRKYQGYIIIEMDNSATIYTGSSSFDKTKFLNLQASALVNVSIWVF